MLDINIEQKFENFAAKLTVPEEIEKKCRTLIYNLYQNLNNYWSPSFKGYEFGGSFDRHTYVPERFDIDVYFIFQDTFGYSINMLQSPGGILLRELWSRLNFLANQGIIALIDREKYLHAIPIKINELKVDCIPAIQSDPSTNPNLLIIPEGNSSKKVSPARDEEALSEINKKQNGKITKLIRVLKFWNYQGEAPLRSYYLERLVLEIFKELEIKNWENAIRNFFQMSCYILSNNKKIPDLINPTRSILDDLRKEELDNMYNALAKAVEPAQKGNWSHLFGNYF